MPIKNYFKVRTPLTPEENTRLFLKKYKNQYVGCPLADDNAYVGIEIEVENVRKAVDSLLFASKEDGSLRNAGVEFVSYPLSGKWIGMALRQLYDELPEGVQFSQRTSIHIHLDVQTLEPADLYRLMIIYLTVEPLLYQWVGKDRGDNIFCRPWYQIKEVNELLVALQSFETYVPMVGNIQSNNQRYSGLNFECLGKFGTIEFRQLGGTKDVDKIINWINLILSLKVSCKRWTTPDLIDRVCNLNTKSDYMMFVQEVFGEWLDIPPNLSALLEMGSKVVKRSAINNPFVAELAKVHPESAFHRTCVNLRKSPKGKGLDWGVNLNLEAFREAINLPDPLPLEDNDEDDQ